MPYELSRECLYRAKPFLSKDDPDCYRYASLQLRMAIEYLFYELLSQHREELPDDITRFWKPQEIIDAILECDPTADQEQKLWLGAPGPDGNLAGPCLALKIKPPNKKLLRKHYHRLGKYLHAPVDLQTPPLEKWKADLEGALLTLDDWCNDVATSNFGQFATIECKRCGRQIKRNVLGIEATGEMRCPDPKCRAIYDVEHLDIENDRIRYRLRETPFDCPSCKKKSHISTGAICAGLKITCVECGDLFEVYPTLSLRKANQPT